jgi:hypothetical protein
MSDNNYAELKRSAMDAGAGEWGFDRPSQNKGCWIHTGRRVHVADNVSVKNTAYLMAASPKKIIDLVDDFQQERAGRVLAEQELEALRRENESLRAGVKGDFDLDAWLNWCTQKRSGEIVPDAKVVQALRDELKEAHAQLGKDVVLKADGLRFQHLKFNCVDWHNNGTDDDSVMMTYGPYPLHKLREFIDADITKAKAARHE